MGKVIGIDLGTTNSCVAVMEGGEAQVIINSEGKRTTPSIVHINKDGERKVGGHAKRQATVSPENTIASVKRFMGRSWDECKTDAKKTSYKVKKGSDGNPKININNKDYPPQEISAMVLSVIKSAAEDYLGEEVTEAVVTVPAYFNDAQRKATKEAGAIAGLDVKRIINEPTAAALAYGIDKSTEERKIAVFDLGGGTFDISILEISDGVFQVSSTNGDTHLGGDDFDKVITDWIVAEIKKEHDWDATTDAKAYQRIKDAAETAKIELSGSNETIISLPYIGQKDGAPFNVDMTLSKAKFESMCDGLIKRCMTPVKKALKDAKLKPEEIDDVIMVGGSTRIPRVQEEVKTFFGKELNKSVNPDEVVALGAAIQGGVLSGDVKDILLLDVTPLTLSIETYGGQSTAMIKANTTIPHQKKEKFTTASDNQPSVDIHILQGERAYAKDNKSLGKFVLEGIPPARRGQPQIEVTMDINADGILEVSAQDLGTGNKQQIRIEGSTSLDDAEIERMKQDAEMHKEEDEARRQEQETINESESLYYRIESFVKESGDKVSETDKETLEHMIKELKAAIEDKNIDDVVTHRDNLQEEFYRISSELYAQTQQESENVAQDEEPLDEDSIEVDYEEIKAEEEEETPVEPVN